MTRLNLVLLVAVLASALLLVRMQYESRRLYAEIDKAEGAIDWSEPAAALERRLRAFDPAPGMHFALGGERKPVLDDLGRPRHEPSRPTGASSSRRSSPRSKTFRRR